MCPGPVAGRPVEMFMREGKSMDNRSAAVAQAVELIRQSKAGRGDHDYISFHSRRWKYLFELCLRFLPPRQSRVLDIGRTQFSYDLAGYYAEVETLGFPLEEEEGQNTAAGRTPPKTMPHITFDLNQSQDPLST